MAYDKTTFLSGLAMGLCGKGEAVSGAVGMYSYNGVQFPALPERDETVYPNATIYSLHGGIRLRFHGGVPVRDEDRNSLLYIGFGGTYPQLLYAYTNGAWSNRVAGNASEILADYIIWANTDIYNTDGTLYLAASDPIPDTFSNGYLAGAKLRAKRVIVEPVAYLYNGVELPALPEWDKETYPYAYIFHSSASASYHLVCYPVELVIIKHYEDYFGEGIDYLHLNPGDEDSSPTISFTYYPSESTAWGEVEQDRWTTGFSCALGETYFGAVRDMYFWCNTNVAKSDGTVIYSATTPLPVKLFESGTWSFNGTELPHLPTWDMAAYPYAVINTDGDGTYTLIVSTSPAVLTTKSDGTTYFTYNEWTANFYYLFGIGDTEWVYDFANGSPDNKCIIPGEQLSISPSTDFSWSNTDVSWADGTLYLAATEPIPVYE